jgi:hypothetical protein
MSSIPGLARILPFIFFLVLTGCLPLEELTRGSPNPAGSNPTANEVATAVRQALEQGVRHSVARLGQTDGFYADNQVRIPLPSDLQRAEKLLRKLGQGKYADQFVLSLNRAAEQAVPEAVDTLTDAVRRMTIQDAVAIVRGPDNAATEYFRNTSGAALTARFKPIVSNATRTVGVTKAYKTMLQKTGGLAEQFLDTEALDVDAYVTARAVNALFLYIAAEEAKLRRDPLSRSTELLREVFGYYLD